MFLTGKCHSIIDTMTFSLLGTDNKWFYEQRKCLNIQFKWMFESLYSYALIIISEVEESVFTEDYSGPFDSVALFVGPCDSVATIFLT